jgi:hypothetical protein
MAIKAGQILHVANSFVVDRIQTGGPGNLDIPQEKVNELGNYQSVGIVRDVPELTFSLECLDVDTEVEALMQGSDSPHDDARGDLRDPTPGTTVGTKYETAKCRPIDIISPWKSPDKNFEVVHGVAVPNLYLESASYRYGLAENAGETFSLRGDSIFYVPGVPRQMFVVLTADADVTGTEIAFTNGPALLYVESGRNVYALSVSADGERLTPGDDYTETATGITLTTAGQDKLRAKLPTTATPGQTVRLSIVYGVARVAGTPYNAPSNNTQTGPSPFNTSEDPMHQGTTVKPAAIRGKDIDVYFAPRATDGTYPARVRWPDVQSATLEWRQTLEEDREFGNPRAIGRDATDVPTVNGTVEIKPRSVEAFFTRLRQITGISDVNQIMGPQSSIIGRLEVELRNPESGGTSSLSAGRVLKTHRVDDARFTMPGYEGRVQQKMTTTINWESDTGLHEVYRGSGPMYP